jgi:hypothetical protein
MRTDTDREDRGDATALPSGDGEPRRQAAARSTSPARLTKWAGATPYERLATALHLLSLCVALVFLVYVDRHVWFSNDDWDFLSERGLHGATLSIWAPHNQHWSTIPILIWRGLFSLVALRTAVPYVLLDVMAHLSLAHVLWRGMRAMGVEPLVNTALVAVFAFLGAGAADILRQFQIGFTGAVLLGWVFIILENHEQPAIGVRDLAAWAVSIACLMFSGIAVTMVVVGGLVALARRGWRAGCLAVAPATGAFTIWFVLAGSHNYGLGQSLRSTLLAVPDYTYQGLVGAATHAADLGVLGPVGLVALGLWLLVRRDLVRTVAAPAFAGAAGAVIFFVITAFGRVQLGSIEATDSRYAYVAVALALPAVGIALTAIVLPRAGGLRRTRRRPTDGVRPPATGLASDRLRNWRLVVLLCALVVVGISNLSQLITYRNSNLAYTSQTEGQVIAAVRIGTSEPTIPGSLPVKWPFADQLTIGKLIMFSRQGLLPTGFHPNEGEELTAHTYTQIGDTGDEIYPSRGSTVVSTSSGVNVVTQGSCISEASATAAGLVVLQVSSPVSLAVRDASHGRVTVVLTAEALRGPAVTFALPRSGTSWLDDAWAGSTIDVYLPPGATLGAC